MPGNEHRHPSTGQGVHREIVVGSGPHHHHHHAPQPPVQVVPPPVQVPFSYANPHAAHLPFFAPQGPVPPVAHQHPAPGHQHGHR